MGCGCGASSSEKVAPSIQAVVQQDCLYTLEELQAMIPKAESLGSIQLSVLMNQINIIDANCGVFSNWIKENIADV